MFCIDSLKAAAPFILNHNLTSDWDRMMHVKELLFLYRPFSMQTLHHKHIQTTEHTSITYFSFIPLETPELNSWTWSINTEPENAPMQFVYLIPLVNVLTNEMELFILSV